MKYLTANISFGVLNEEISLAIEITQCPHRCIGCHSPELRQNIGQELTQGSLQMIINEFCDFDMKPLFSCLVFMGGDQHPVELCELLDYIKHKYPHIKTALYTGSSDVSDEIRYCLDYLKTGKYIPELGGLDSIYTNQKITKIGV